MQHLRVMPPPYVMGSSQTLTRSTKLQLAVSMTLLILLVVQHRALLWPFVVALMPVLLSLPVCLLLRSEL